MNNAKYSKPSRASVGISKQLARSFCSMTMPERKLCCLYLSKIKYLSSNNNLMIWIECSEIQAALGLNIDTEHHAGQYLQNLALSMMGHDYMRFKGLDADKCRNVHLFTEHDGDYGKMALKLNPDAMIHLQDLAAGNYIVLMLQDIIGMPSSDTGARAMVLYEYLLLHADTRKECKRTLSTRELKELWNMPKTGKGSYTRKTGKFDRQAFEKYVLIPVLNALKSCKHVLISDCQKIKRHGLVAGYQFTYSVAGIDDIAPYQTEYDYDPSFYMDEADDIPEVIGDDMEDFN